MVITKDIFDMIKGLPKSPPAYNEKKADHAAQKEKRLAQALRENLKRRKESKKDGPEEGSTS